MGIAPALSYLISHGMSIFTTKFLLLGVPAFFYSLFGVNAISINMFDFICLVGSLLSIFCIGSLLSSQRSGVISALMFAFVPMVILETDSAGDGLPLVLFSSLAVLSLLFAIRRRNEPYYALSSFVIFLGALASNDEVFITLISIFLFLCYQAVIQNFKSSACRA